MRYVFLFIAGIAAAFMLTGAGQNPSDTWPASGTKAGVEVRILMSGNLFKNPVTGLTWDNTSAVCTPLGDRWSCVVKSGHDGSTVTINVNGEGN